MFLTIKRCTHAKHNSDYRSDYLFKNGFDIK